MLLGSLLVLISTMASAGDRFAVLVFNDRYAPPIRVEPASLDEKGLSGVRAAWMWSAEASPKRIDAAEVRRVTPVRATTWLSVRVERGRSRDKHFVVIAAPAGMWEEVPEEILPSANVDLTTKASAIVRFPMDPKLTWRFRLIGVKSGSWWVDVPPAQQAARVAPVEAIDRAIEIRDEEGRGIAGVRLSLLDEGAERGEFRKLADFRTDSKGRITVRSLPDSSSLTLMLAAVDRAPHVLEAKPALIPNPLVLRRGRSVAGKLVDRDGHPVAQAAVTIRMWASDLLPIPLVRSSSSDADGKWDISALPDGKAEWEASAVGFADETRTLTIENQAVDLGRIILEPAVVAGILASDDRGEPVTGASVAIGPRIAATTDIKGRARLKVGAQQTVDVRVSAPHHRSRTATIDSRSGVQKVVLQRAFRVLGRFLAGEMPVSEGHIRAKQGPVFESTDINPDGTFELDLEADTDYELELLSPHAAVANVNVGKGIRGEIRDLGDIIAPHSVVVRGRLIRETDSAPVAGARVWLPRPSSSGPLMAWAFRDLLETKSDPDGRFELSGVPESPFLLRIEASSLAPMRRAITPESGSDSLDLGDLFLINGATVIVHLEGDQGNEAVARVDTGGYGLKIDSLTASFSNGTATVTNVPTGSVVVSAWRKREMLCRKDLVVSAEHSEVEMSCTARKVTVTGVVTVGGRAPGQGTVVWLTPVPADLPTGIVNYGSGALMQQQVFSPESAQETADVGLDGLYQARLIPGSWEVIWMPENGRAVGPRLVTIPALAVHHLDLDYPGLTVEGVVLDSSRSRIKGAEVRDIADRGFAVTREDGSFTLAGPDAGTWRLRARYRGEASAVAEVVVEAGKERPFVELILKADESNVRVSVETNGGRASGAMVFLETDSGRIDLASADQTGSATFRVIPPFPERIRVAASAGGVWSFGDWTPWKDATRDALTLNIAPAGGIVLRTKGPTGPVVISSASGWRVDRLLQWFGAFLNLAPGTEVTVSGLPPGTYTFVVASQRRTVSVEREKILGIVFD